MNATPLIVISLMLVGIGAYWFTQQSSEQPEAMMEKDASYMEESEDAMSTDEVMMEKDDSMMNKEDDAMEDDMMMMQKKDDSMMQAGSYEAYDSATLARANDGDVVLFFRASWCPTCRALDADLRDSLRDIPANVTILDVNYDTATQLRKKYGVTMQHTLVQVDADGTLLTKWSGGNTLESLLGKLI